DSEPFGRGHGTLIAVNGATTWGNGETPITLAGNTVSIGIATATDSLSFNGTVVGSGIGLSKAGGGTLVLGGVAPNTYSGTTFINDGTLALNKSPGMPAMLGALNVGDNIGTGTDVLELRSSEQLPYGGATSVPAISPNVLASGRIQTTAAMSATTTPEVQAIVFAGTTAGNA